MPGSRMTSTNTCCMSNRNAQIPLSCPLSPPFAIFILRLRSGNLENTKKRKLIERGWAEQSLRAELGARLPSMADQASHEVAPSPDGAGKKELTKDQLKTYVHKARSKIRKLEEQNQSLLAKVEEATQQQQRSASANGADKGETSCVCLRCVSAHSTDASLAPFSATRGVSGLLTFLCIWSDDLCRTRDSIVSPRMLREK